MEVTEVRVKLAGAGSADRLRAFCSIALDGCFVVSDVRVIEVEGRLTVSMPRKRFYRRCRRCGGRNHLLAKFCNDCGAVQGADQPAAKRLYADVAHPVTGAMRDRIYRAVLAAVEAELERVRSQRAGVT